MEGRYARLLCKTETVVTAIVEKPTDGTNPCIRTMQAYERSMQHSDTHLVLRPDTDFFRFFNDPTGKTAPQNAAAPGVPPGAASASGGNRERQQVTQ